MVKGAHFVVKTKGRHLEVGKWSLGVARGLQVGRGNTRGGEGGALHMVGWGGGGGQVDVCRESITHAAIKQDQTGASATQQETCGSLGCLRS
jgi:hypothetical protein